MAEERKKVVILGGGLAGLSSGVLLLKKGFEVSIVERSAELGGLAVTRSDNEFKWDLGPHNIHTPHAHVIDFLKRSFPEMYEHDVPSLIYKRGKLLSYPLKGIKVISTLPPLRLLQAATSFFFARLRMLLTNPKQDATFEDWIRNRFGTVLFEEYFHDYPKKVWGLPTKKIDRYVAEKRVPIISLLELVRALFFKGSSTIDHPEWNSKNFYLPDGIGQIPEYLAREFSRLGGKVYFSSTPESIQVSETEKRVSGVSIRRSTDNSREEVTCDVLLSTIPVNDFVRLFPNCDEGTKNEASQLDYVASVLLFLKTTRENVLPSKLLYFSEPELLYSRVSDVGGFSRKMVPVGKNLVCLEFPCTVGDAIWQKDTESLTDHAVQTLISRKVLKEADVYGSFCERVSHSYPRFKDGFQKHLAACHSFLTDYENCLSFGRQGGFQYVNTDAVMHQGFKAASAVVMRESLDMSISKWFKSL
jgi:protoporphyrinogen oxidase